MQIPIISGIYADGSPDFRTSYPVNMVPVPKSQGISNGYLRHARGLVSRGLQPSHCRGGIDWHGEVYRVFGTDVVKLDSLGGSTSVGTVATGDAVSMDYGPDRLAIASGGKLYYTQGGATTEQTDVDFGTVLDVVWLDGYFVTTDGEFIVVTDLNDPTSVNPLKYGSSEVDPDPIVAVKKLRNELVAVNRYTVETFSNVGGSGFPFAVVAGAQAQRGAVGTKACVNFADGIAILGGGKRESIGVHIVANGATTKISSAEIDTRLKGYTADELGGAVLESMEDEGHNTLFVHLPNTTLCFDFAASQALGSLVWYELSGGRNGDEIYAGRFFVFSRNEWTAASPIDGNYGVVSDTVATQWDTVVPWEFGLPILYNEGRGAVVHSLRVVALGKKVFGSTPVLQVQYSDDGITWSEPKTVSVANKAVFRRLGFFQEKRIFKFRGDSNILMTTAAIEAELEGLAW